MVFKQGTGQEAGTAVFNVQVDVKAEVEAGSRKGE